MVVDNGSLDGSAQLDSEFHNIHFFRLPKNFGLTKALNIGVRAADAEYALLLHEDTEVAPDAIELLANTLDANPDAAAACPLLVDAEGHAAPQLGHFPPDDVWCPAEGLGSDPMPVQYPRGAALMVRVFFIKAVRQIDERFGQFGGDADIAAQIRRSTKKMLLVPGARVTHFADRPDCAAFRADALLARAAFQWKYGGFSAGLQASLSAMFGPLFHLHLGEFRYTISGQKINGAQP